MLREGLHQYQDRRPTLDVFLCQQLKGRESLLGEGWGGGKPPLPTMAQVANLFRKAGCVGGRYFIAWESNWSLAGLQPQAMMSAVKPAACGGCCVPWGLW